MDMFKGLQWIVLIFVFYIFIFYQLFRIICRKFKESDLGSKITIQNLDKKLPNQEIKFKNQIKKSSNQKI